MECGAGSGSVSIEAPDRAQRHDYAIEMDAEDHELIQSNAEKFGVTNLVAVLGRAPEAWANLPDPDARVCRWFGPRDQSLDRTGLRSSATRRSAGRQCRQHRESGRRPRHVARPRGERVNVWMINVARGTYQLERVRFEALNPTFLLSVVKPTAS